MERLKHHIVLILIILFSTVVFFSCSGESENIPVGKKISEIEATNWENSIESNINKLNDSILMDSSVKEFMIRKKYTKLYGLKYIQDSNYRNKIGKLFDTLADEGFPIKPLALNFLNKQPNFSDTNLRIQEDLPIKIDIVLSHAILSLKKWSDWGMLNPEKYLSIYQKKRIKKSIPENYLDSISEMDLDSMFIQTVRTNKYQILKAAYRKIRLKKDDIKPLKIPPFKNTLLSGEYNPRIIFIRKQLSNLGYSIVADTSTLFDDTLSKYITKWQKENNYVADGKIGAETYEMLFLDNRKKLIKLQLALERERWLNHFNIDHRYVWVNLAAAQVRLKAKDSVVIFKTCSGRRPDKKTDMRTPQIVSYINFVQAYPYWRVPHSISHKEIYPAILRDTSYIRKNHYELVRGKEVISDSGIKWRRLNPKKLPFIFRQTPGTHNSLGLLKFNIINDMSIYMHDTPNKWAFKHPYRWVSHGCVRLENPLEMARYLLARNKEDDQRIPEILYDEEKRTESDTFDGSEPITISMKKSIPVYFDYRTAWVTEEDKAIQFNFDVYSYDEKLYQDLRRKYKYDRYLW